ARQHDLAIGPGRGGSSSSIVLYGLDCSQIDPTSAGLIPERWSVVPPELHLDVEYERGQVFVDYCRKMNDQLNWGGIQAFKMPLIDILKRVCQRIGQMPQTSGDDPAVLSMI